jgi:peptidylamidoglycolate lyase
LHQVFRFNIKNSTLRPDLVLGEAFKPGKSAKLFCKPTSVASLENGDFFVADGYCNSRVIKFNYKGEKILEVS